MYTTKSRKQGTDLPVDALYKTGIESQARKDSH